MKGKQYIKIKNNKLSYSIELERKITVIKGNSGTGKTTLVKMIDLWLRQKRASGIKCNCSADMIILNELSDWTNLLNENSGKIFIADENVKYLSWQSFGEAVNNSDNYFLFITRSGSLGSMTYSVSSILELKTEKRGDIHFTSAYPRYFNTSVYIKPDLVITEDSNSGNDMMKRLLPSTFIKSSYGRSNAINVFKSMNNKYSNIVIFVDGSAFGACIADYTGYFDKVTIVAPESFEYLLLNLDFIKKFVIDELNNTADYCNFDKDIISYERYYTELLKTTLKDNYNKNYVKSRLINFFINDNVFSQIKNMLSDIDFYNKD